MLMQLASHGLEDVGISLGQALGDPAGLIVSGMAPLDNDHHVVEACFKAFARALRMATEVDPRRSGQVPSSKGVLEQAGGV